MTSGRLPKRSYIFVGESRGWCGSWWDHMPWRTVDGVRCAACGEPMVLALPRHGKPMPHDPQTGELR